MYINSKKKKLECTIAFIININLYKNEIYIKMYIHKNCKESFKKEPLYKISDNLEYIRLYNLLSN